MTITEFLLARIAEDEAVARGEVERVAGSPRRYGKSLALRLARECEAKRRIVEYLHVECGGHPGPWLPHNDYGPGRCARADEQDFVILQLASVYADHPDYDEAWRV